MRQNKTNKQIKNLLFIRICQILTIILLYFETTTLYPAWDSIQDDGSSTAGSWAYYSPVIDAYGDDYYLAWGSNGTDKRRWTWNPPDDIIPGWIQAQVYIKVRSANDTAADYYVYYGAGTWHGTLNQTSGSTGWRTLTTQKFTDTASAYIEVSSEGGGDMDTQADAARLTLVNPGAPGVPYVSSYSGGSQNVTWSWSAGSYVISYDVAYRSRTPGGSWGAWNYLYATTTTNSKQLTGLTYGLEYMIAVRTRNGDYPSSYANVSDWSYDKGPFVLIIQTPSDPTVDNPTTTSLRVDVNPGSNATTAVYAIKVVYGATTKYVQSNGTLGDTEVWQTDATWGATTVSGLTPNTQYTFSVSADAPSGNYDSPPSPYGATTSKYTLANPPTAVTWGSITSTSISFSWSANSNPSGTVYHIEHSINGTDWSEIQTTTSLSYTHSGLTPNTIHYYRVRAKNGDGVYTAYAYPSPAYKYTLANTPLSPTYGTITTTSIELVWSANNNASGTVYHIEHSVNGTDWSEIQTTTNLSYVHSGLGVNTIHYYRMRARNGDGVYTSYVNFSPQYKYTYCNIPSAPTITVLSSSTINVVINENGNPDYTTFSIKFVYGATTKYVQSNYTLGDTAVYQTKSAWGTIDVMNLAANTQYSVSVDAKNGDGVSSGYSSSVAKYTFAKEPSVSCNKLPGTPYDTNDFTFTNIAGWGSGGVQYYRYVFNSEPSYTFNDTETQWSAGNLTVYAPQEGSYYLHLKSYNGDDIGVYTKSFGPYLYGLYYGGVPKMSSDTAKDILQDVFALAGNLMSEETVVKSTVNYALGEPGGISTYTATDKFLSAGFYGVDFIGPEAITNIVTYRTEQIKLRWLSTGDDLYEGTIYGGGFLIQYSTNPNTQWDYNNYNIKLATDIAQPATYYEYIFTEFIPEATYYFRIWTIDSFYNISPISYGATVQAGYFCQFKSIEPALAYAQVSFCDYNNDGWIDFAICGSTAADSPKRYTRIYKNIGGDFVLKQQLTGINYGDVKWIDYNNDGFADLFIIGFTGSELVKKMYRYYPSSDNFVEDATAVSTITAVSSGGPTDIVDVGDYNNDGWLDLVIIGTGTTGSPLQPQCKLYKNINGVFYQDNDMSANLPAVAEGCVRFFDYDNDGDLDIILSGNTGTSFITRIYRNDTTSYILVQSLTGLRYSNIAIADYDNDGDLDFFIIGHTGAAGFTKLYRNDNGTFNDSGQSFGTAVWSGRTFFGDFNNDGWLDLIYCGTTGTDRVLKIYRNKNGTFELLPDDLSSSKVTYGSVSFADIDNDGDLDFLVTGRYTGTPIVHITRIYKNRIADSNLGNKPNTAPSPPDYTQFSSSYTPTNRLLVLSFPNGSDIETTDPDGLYYNIRVGTQPSSNYYSPSYYANFLLGKYLRPRKPAENKQYVYLKNLPPDTTIYWQIQTIDSGLRCSSWSQPSVVITSHPPAAVTTLTAKPGYAKGYIKLSWITPGDNDWDEEIVNGKYSIKYSSVGEITDWDNPPNPTYTITFSTNIVPLTQHCLMVRGLEYGATYYFRLKTADAKGFWSEMSNSTSCWAQSVAQVVINEICPAGGSGTNWVELYSRYDEELKLDGWKLNYWTSNSQSLAGITLSTGSVIAIDTTFDMSYNLSRTVGIVDNYNVMVDTVWYLSVYTNDTGDMAVSWARVYDGADYFERDPTPTKGIFNAVRPSDTDSYIKINEVAYDTLDTEFVELVNTLATAYNISKWWLRNKYSVRSSDPVRRPMQISLHFDPYGFNSKNYTSFSSSVTAPTSLNMDISSFTWDFCFSYTAGSGLTKTADFVALENTYGQVVDRICWWSADGSTLWYDWQANQITSYPNYAAGNQDKPKSVGRYPDDGKDNFTVLSQSSEGGKNKLSDYVDQIIKPQNNQKLPRSFDITIDLDADSTSGVFDTIRFNYIGLAAETTDFYSPHYYRLTDINFNLAVLTPQTTAGFTPILFTDINGNTLVSQCYYNMFLKTDVSTASAKAVSVTGLLYDADAPAAVGDLVAETDIFAYRIKLTWTSPGDNWGSAPLPAGSSYYIMYTTISELAENIFWWESSKSTGCQIIISTGPVEINTPELYIAGGLEEGVTYYFRMWVVDNAGNWSEISNAATAWAQWYILGVEVLTDPATYYDFGWLETNISSIAAFALNIKNTGTVYETYKLRLTTGPPYTVWDSSTTNYYDRFVLQGIFYKSEETPLNQYFNSSAGDDVIIYWGSIPASGTNFARDEGLIEDKGIYVYPLTSRALWFRLTTPLAVSTTEQQIIPVVIHAEESQ
jgi:hypothetical protein